MRCRGGCKGRLFRVKLRPVTRTAAKSYDGGPLQEADGTLALSTAQLDYDHIAEDIILTPSESFQMW